MIARIVRTVLLIFAFAFLMLIFAGATQMFGQAPAAQTIPAAVTEKLTELEQARLQVLLEKQKRLQAQYDAAVQLALQALRATPEVKKIMDEAEQVGKDQNALIEAAFAAHKVDISKMRLDASTGAFVDPAAAVPSAATTKPLN